MRFFASVIFILSDSVARVTTSNFSSYIIIVAVKFYTRTSCSYTKLQSVWSKLMYVHDLISLTRMPHRIRFMLSCETKRTKWKSTAKQIVAPAPPTSAPCACRKKVAFEIFAYCFHSKCLFIASSAFQEHAAIEISDAKVCARIGVSV